MGCGCSQIQRDYAGGDSHTSNGGSGGSGRRAPGSFLATTSIKDFVRSLSAEEMRDKKRLVVWFRMQKDGSFDEPCRRRPDVIYNRAISDGVPLRSPEVLFHNCVKLTVDVLKFQTNILAFRFRWLFFRSVTDYKNGYRTGAFDTLAEKGRNTLMRSLRTIASTPLRTMNAGNSMYNFHNSTLQNNVLQNL